MDKESTFIQIPACQRLFAEYDTQVVVRTIPGGNHHGENFLLEVKFSRDPDPEAKELIEGMRERVQVWANHTAYILNVQFSSIPVDDLSKAIIEELRAMGYEVNTKTILGRSGGSQVDKIQSALGSMTIVQRESGDWR